MAASVAQRRQWRDEFLRRTYEAAEGNTIAIVQMRDIGSSIGIGPEDLDATARWLEGEGLISWQTMGGGISITHQGVKRIEDEEPPPVSLTAVPPIVLKLTERQELERVIGSVRAAMDAGDPALTKDQEAELNADLDSAGAQLRSPEPKRAIVKVALESVLGRWKIFTAGVVIGMVGNGAYEGLHALVGKL